ncbi:MAG: hypothetical protein ACUVWA_14355 [Candidatus Oleimicrobiaceae bacterium]
MEAKKSIGFSVVILMVMMIIALMYGLTGFILADTEPEKILPQKDAGGMYAPAYTVDAGDILCSFTTNQEETMGVTVVGDKVIVSVGGDSSDASDSKFFVYNLDGTFVQSYPHGSATGLGFRDLAFDSTHIFAREDNTIKKIDPNTF